MILPYGFLSTPPAAPPGPPLAAAYAVSSAIGSSGSHSWADLWTFDQAGAQDLTFDWSYSPGIYDKPVNFSVFLNGLIGGFPPESSTGLTYSGPSLPYFGKLVFNSVFVLDAVAEYVDDTKGIVLGRFHGSAYELDIRVVTRSDAEGGSNRGLGIYLNDTQIGLVWIPTFMAADFTHLYVTMYRESGDFVMEYFVEGSSGSLTAAVNPGPIDGFRIFAFPHPDIAVENAVTPVLFSECTMEVSAYP